MAARFAGVALYAFAGLLSATPAAAQGTVWRIDSAQSNARLYVTSTTRRDARINVGVARLTGNILQGDGSVLPATVAFQIYPADRNAKLRKPDGTLPSSQTQIRANSTTIAFRSRHVQLLDQKSVLVRGDLTTTYVSQTADYDPSRGYSGPVYGPPVIHSVKREVGFVFRVAPPAGKREGWKGERRVVGLQPDRWRLISGALERRRDHRLACLHGKRTVQSARGCRRRFLRAGLHGKADRTRAANRHALRHAPFGGRGFFRRNL